MTDSNSILIVDDEPDIQSLVQRYFSKHGFDVHCAGCGTQMHKQLAQRSFDIILLDVCLPGSSGFELLPQIKAQTQSAVIMLTGQANTQQRIAGLNQGADDYLSKPFDLGELQARVNAVLRRKVTEISKADMPKSYRFEGFTLDTRTRTIVNAKGENIKLTPAEYELLLVMLKNAGVVLDRDYLLITTRGRLANVNDRAIDVRLSQLRKKLFIKDRELPLFLTVRSGGYMLDCEVDVINESKN